MVNNRLVSRVLNASIVRPIQKLYPKVIINNFSVKYRREPSPTRWWPYAFGESSTPPAGTGAHVGTHQGGAFYGESNRSKVLITANLDSMQSADCSPFNTLLHAAAVATDMVSAAPHVQALPWLEPDTTSYAGGSVSVCRQTHLACCCKFPGDMVHVLPLRSQPILQPIWSDHLFHLSPRLAARRFLWWRAGDDYPLTRGMGTLSRALHEMDTVINNATDGAWSRDGQACGFTTIAAVAAQELSWLE